MAQHTSARIGSGVRVTRGLAWAVAVVAVPYAAPGQVAPPATDPPPAAVVVAPPVPPAVADIQAALDQKQYGPAVRAAIKLLAARGPAAAGVSRFQVTMLKGDGQLGQRQFVAARATYKDAAGVTRDPHERALATWTLELLRRAKGTAYVPHMAGAAAGAAGPLDLLTPDGRRAAFAALLDDQLSLISPQVKVASSSPSLPQILPVVQQVQSLAELDEIANGSDARTAATAGTLLDHARTLMATALKGMWTRVDDIHTAAVQPVTGGGGTVLVNGQPIQQTVTGENGLTAGDAAELRATIDTATKIRDAATTFMPLAAGGAAKDWGAVQNDATRVAGRAADVLNANYASTSVATQYPDDGAGVGTGVNTGITASGYGTNSTYYPPGGNGTSNGTFPNTAVNPNGTVRTTTPVTGGTTPSHPGLTPTPNPPAVTPPAKPNR